MNSSTDYAALVERAMALANAATPGPWRATPNPMRDDGLFVNRHVPDAERRRYQARTLDAYLADRPADFEPLPAIIDCQVPHADARFIAASRQLIPELCEALTRLSQPAWRCFHCDEVFTTSKAAREHFGTEDVCHPACQIDVAEYRRMEEVHAQHLHETDAASRQFYAMRADHAAALIREEERGYARGLADARLSQPSGEEIREAAAKIAEAEAVGGGQWTVLTATNIAAAIRSLPLSSGSNKSDDGKKGQTE